MSLFRSNGRPLKFHLVDIDRDEVIALKELIEDAGGEVADDEETLVKFTSPDASRTKSYIRAKIYDVAFIVESFKEKRFVEPEKYRLGKKIPGDEFIMLHFLYGDCSCARREIESKGNPPQSIAASQSSNSGRLVIGENSDFFATAQSSNGDEDRSQLAETNAAILNPPPSAAFLVDESQPVVDELELAMIYHSSLASGDVAENVNTNQEKRPCNLEYERDVEPKMIALADEARRLVRSRERLSVRKSPQPPRSPRTVARKNLVANVVSVKPEVPSDAERAESFSSPSRNQNDCSSDASTIQVIDVRTETPEAPVETIQIHDSPADCSPANPESPKKATHWISTKKPPAKKPTNDRTNSKVARAPNASETTKVLNIWHKATRNGEKLSGSAEKPNLPGRTEHKRTKKISEGAKSESKGDKEARPVANNPKKRKSTGRRLPPLRKTLHDHIYGSSGASSSSLDGEPSKSKRSRNRVSPSDSSDEVVVSDSDSDEKSQPHRRRTSHEAGPSGVRREPQNHADYESSGTETHRHKHQPRTEIHASKSESKKKSPREKLPNGTKRSQDDLSQYEASQLHRRKGSNEAGPSGFRTKAEIYTDDDDESSNEDKYEPKIETHVKINRSRGAIWRANLLNKVQRNYNHLSRKPFTPPERLKMLRYLVKKNAIHMAKGLVIWTQMIDDGYLTHRTPQSLQNHFVKQILPNIRSVDAILSSDMKKFLALKGEK